MSPSSLASRWPVQVGVGFVAGLIVVLVDNVAFKGEVSPILIVAMLLAATGAAGFTWGVRGRVAAATAWLCVPLAHLIKHLLDVPDTLHPNTYFSILMLAAFTLLVAAVGIGCGILLRSGTTETASDPPRRA